MRHSDALPAGQLCRRREITSEHFRTPEISLPGLGDGVVDRPGTGPLRDVHPDGMEEGRLQLERPPRGVRVEHDTGAQGGGRHDAGMGVEEHLEDEGRRQARRRDPRLGQREAPVGLDPPADRPRVTQRCVEGDDGRVDPSPVLTYDDVEVRQHRPGSTQAGGEGGLVAGLRGAALGADGPVGQRVAFS